MSAASFAPKVNGVAAYVVEKSSWGKTWEALVWEANLAEAKRHHGWTREMHTSVKVRRATVEDVERIGGAQ